MNLREKKEIKHKLLRYIIPSVSAMWVYTIYTMVDGMFVARGVSPTALAAVNLCMPFISVAFGIGILFAVGTSTRASIHRGRGEMEVANRIFTMNTLTAFCVAIAITLVAYFNIDFFAKLLGSTEETHQYVVDYLKLILIFIPCYIGAYNLEVLIKADGFPQKAIFTAVIGAVTNIVLDYFFVILFQWGVKGAAFATGLAQLECVLVYIVHFCSPKSNFSFVRVRWRITEILKTVKLGVADCMNEFSVAIVTFLFNNVLIAVTGNEGVVIYTIILYVTQLTLNTMMGVNQGMQPLVSYYHGKGTVGAPKYIMKLSLCCSMIIGLAAFLVCIIGSPLVVGAFIDKVEEVTLFTRGVRAFRIYAYCFLPLGAVMALNGYFTALERPKSAMAVSICRGFVFVLAALLVMSSFFGETGIWLSMGVSEWSALALALVLYRYNFDLRK